MCRRSLGEASALVLVAVLGRIVANATVRETSSVVVEPNGGITTLPNSSTEGGFEAICLRPENNGRQITDPDFINRYIRCIDRDPVVVRCSNTRYFFEFVEQCVPVPDNAPFPSERMSGSVSDGRIFARPCHSCSKSCGGDVCSGGGGGSGGDDGDAGSGGGSGNDKPPTSTTTTTTTTPSTTTTESPEYRCPEEDVGFPVNIGHPCGCRKYQICEHGVKRVAFCKVGQIYDIPRRICNRASDVKCPNEGHDCDNVTESRALDFATYGGDVVFARAEKRCSPPPKTSFSETLPKARNFQFQNLYYDMYGSCRGENGEAIVMFCPVNQYYSVDMEFCIPVPSDEHWYPQHQSVAIDDGKRYANPCRYCHSRARDAHAYSADSLLMQPTVRRPQRGPPPPLLEDDDDDDDDEDDAKGVIAAIGAPPIAVVSGAEKKNSFVGNVASSKLPNEASTNAVPPASKTDNDSGNVVEHAAAPSFSSATSILFVVAIVVGSMGVTLWIFKRYYSRINERHDSSSGSSSSAVYRVTRETLSDTAAAGPSAVCGI